MSRVLSSVLKNKLELIAGVKLIIAGRKKKVIFKN